MIKLFFVLLVVTGFLTMASAQLQVGDDDTSSWNVVLAGTDSFLDTNATSACSGGQVLFGNGSCGVITGGGGGSDGNTWWPVIFNWFQNISGSLDFDENKFNASVSIIANLSNTVSNPFDQELNTTQNVTFVIGNFSTEVIINDINISVALRNMQSSSLMSGGNFSINATNNSLFNVEATTAWFINNTQGGQSMTYVSCPATTGNTVDFMVTSERSDLALNSDCTYSQKATPFSNAQRRHTIVLGRLVHPDNIAMVATVQLQHFGFEVYSQYLDLTHSIGIINPSGNTYSSADTTLNLTKTSGTMFRIGSNYVNNNENPNVISLDANNLVTLRYRYRDGSGDFTQTTAGTVVDPDSYDDGSGSLATVSPNRFTIQRIYLFSAGQTVLMYGQDTYNKMSEATAAITTEEFVADPNLAEDAALRGWIVIKEGATDLSDTTEVKIISAGKFGSLGGGTGTSAAAEVDLQNTYDNSLNGSIILDSTRDGFKLFDSFITLAGTLFGIYNGQNQSLFNFNSSGDMNLSGYYYGDGSKLDNIEFNFNQSNVEFNFNQSDIEFNFNQSNILYNHNQSNLTWAFNQSDIEFNFNQSDIEFNFNQSNIEFNFNQSNIAFNYNQTGLGTNNPFDQDLNKSNKPIFDGITLGGIGTGTSGYVTIARNRTGGQPVLFVNGSATANGRTILTIQAPGDSDSRYLANFTGGGGQVFITTSGKIGIGTQSPTHALDVATLGRIGGMNIGGYGTTTDNRYISTEGDNIGFLIDSGGAAAPIRAKGLNLDNSFSGDLPGTGEINTFDGDLFFSPANSEAMRILTTGEVGINITTPTSALQIGRGIYTDGAFSMLAVNGAIIISDGNDFSSNLITNGAGLRMTSGGNMEMDFAGQGDINYNTRDLSGSTRNLHFYTGNPQIRVMSLRGGDDQTNEGVVEIVSRLGIGTATPEYTLEAAGNVSLNQTLFVTTAGNVGIGMTNPSAPLDIMSPGTSSNVQEWEASDGSALGEFFENSAGHAHLKLRDASGNQDILFNTNGDSYFDGGQLGIGVTDPADTLEIVPVSAGEGFTIRESDDGNDAFTIDGNADNANVRIWEGGNLRIQFASNTGTDSFINTADNFGIGTANPNYKLEVIGDARMNSINVTHIFSNDSQNAIHFGDTASSGKWEFEDGGVCIGTGGCTAPSTDGRLIVENSIHVGELGNTAGESYNSFGNGDLRSHATINGSEDVFIAGDVEINGNLHADGGLFITLGNCNVIGIDDQQIFCSHNTLDTFDQILNTTHDVLFNSVNATDLCLVSGTCLSDLSAGGTTSDNALFIYDAGGGQVIGNSYINITFDTNSRVDSAYLHTVDGTNVTVQNSGWYDINFQCTAINAHASARYHSDFKIVLNGVDLPGGEGFGYNRIVNDGQTTVGINTIALLSANDELNFQVQSDDAGSDMTVVADACRVKIVVMDNNGGINGTFWNQTGTDLWYTVGNVGIGTESPGATLDVNGNVSIAGNMKIGSPSSVLPGIDSFLYVRDNIIVGDTIFEDTYNSFGDSSLSDDGLSGASDVYIEDDLEVDGTFYLTGGSAAIVNSDVAEVLLTKKGREAVLCNGNPNCTLDKEYIKDELDYGDVVCINIREGRTIERCTDSNSRLVVGVVSNTSVMNMGNNLAVGYPIAVAGIVFTKVSTENGVIYPGDLLVSSGRDGYAMKNNNPSVGTLLGKSYDFCSEDECNILMFIALS